MSRRAGIGPRIIKRLVDRHRKSLERAEKAPVAAGLDEPDRSRGGPLTDVDKALRRHGVRRGDLTFRD